MQKPTQVWETYSLAKHLRRRPSELLRLSDEVQAYWFDRAVTLFGLSLEEQYQCVLDLAQRAKVHGDDIYGMVEGGALPLDMWNQHHRDLFFRRFERDEKGSRLADPLLATWDDQGWQIRELLTKHELRVEGQEMGHCVGGYSQAVSTGRSRILSIRQGANSSRWTTVELSAASLQPGKEVAIRQHYGRRNCTPPKENKEVLQRYLEQESRRLGFQLKGSLTPVYDYNFID